MKRQFQSRRGRSGFSLVEMLVVVGIVAVLLGVAVPSLLYYQRELKHTELDDSARAVFIAVQNHLTALRSANAGELEVSPDVGRPAKAVPGEATEAGTALMYVSTDVADAKPGWLVLPGSIEGDLAEGHYLVEFEPKSGSVYGVFFTQDTELNESAYQRLYNGGANACRTKAGRKAFASASGGFFVGYYGADGALDMDRPDAQTLPKPKLKIINAEELRLEIDTESWPTGIDSSNIYASVSVSDGSAARTLVSKGAMQSGTKGTVVLDTLKPSGYGKNSVQNTTNWTVGNSFARWMKDGEESYVITPGADITVTVSIFYDDAGAGIVALPQSASVTTNSLFAARSGNTAQVAYGRHLQNLHPGVSYLDSTITDVNQIRAIDFAKGGSGVYSWADTYPDTPFVPIVNDNVNTYNGNSLTIGSLNAVKASDRYDNAGLFGEFSGSELKNVTLVDAKASGSVTAGALAGKAKGVTVDNCQAYLTTPTSDYARIQGGNFAGGLIGAAENCTVQNGSFASTVVSGGVATGGLIGQGTSNTKLQSSYAAGHLNGATVGGLVGSGYAVIRNCYAAGTIASATTAAGGLCGTDANVYASYAAVDYVSVPTSDKVYGAAPGGSCTNVYYLAKSGVNNDVFVAGVTSITSPEQMNDDAMIINLGKTIFSKGDNNAMVMPYNLPNQADKTRDPKLSAPYPYPTLGELPHYGDWLVAEAPSVYLAYFEQYADGTYGYQYPTSSGEESTLRDNKGALRNEGYALISKEDPKVIQVAGADMGWSKHTETFTDSANDTFNIYILATDLFQTRHTKAPELGNTSVEYGGYCELTVDGDKIWFNPDFAKTTSLKKPSTANAYTIRSIRHFNNMRRYLASIATWTQELDLDGALYEGYQADGKIAGMATTTGTDGSRYLVMDPITMVSAAVARDSWNKAYDGGGHTIRHVSIQAITGVGEKIENQGRSYAGLFGRTVTVDAKIKDLTVANCDIAGKKLGSEAAYTGALVAYSEGSVENCYAVNCKVTATAGYEGGLLGAARQGTVRSSGVRVENAEDYDKYTVSGGQYVGGLVGYEWDATIEHCYAAVKVSGENAGGFAGRLEGAGSIKNSYAGGHTVDGVYSADAPNVYGTKLAGGFAVKRHATKLVSLENVYTTCSVGVPKGKTADVFAPEVEATPGGFAYAGGDVMVDGAVVSTADHNKAGVTVRALSAQDAATRAQRAAYDNYLNSIFNNYPYRPVLDAEGKPLTHYGDWYYQKSSVKFEWTQDPEVFATVDRPNLSTSANWTGDDLTITFVYTDWGWLSDQFTQSGGHIAITTDLGYINDYWLKVADYNTGAIDIIGPDGLVGTITPSREYVQITEWEWGPKTTYVITLKTEDLPAYNETINIGGFKEGYLVKDLPNNDTSVPAYNPVEKFQPGDKIVIDGDFSDWEGYSHQLITHTPGNASTSGVAIASAFGDGNKIYLHMKNEYPPNLVPNHSGNLTLPIFNFGITTEGYSLPNESLSWGNLLGQQYDGPGLYEMRYEEYDYSTGQKILTKSILQGVAYVVIYEDGSQETEFYFDLENAMRDENGAKVPFGNEIANKILRMEIHYGTMGGTLAIWRDPPN